jgi:hypothetical protein
LKKAERVDGRVDRDTVDPWLSRRRTKVANEDTTSYAEMAE